MKKRTTTGDWLGRDLRTIVIATAVASVVMAAPAVADKVANADKVDGKHAVGAKTPVDKRAGKLVATNKKGLLPNGIIAKAPNADRVDGLDASDLKVTTGGKAGSFVNVPGCSAAVILDYPLEVTRSAHVWASASAATAGASAIRPTVRAQLIDGAGLIVAQTNRDMQDLGSGHALAVNELLFTSVGNPPAPFVAAPGAYTLRIFASNNGACDDTQYVQYQVPRLSHLLVPTAG